MSVTDDVQRLRNDIATDTYTATWREIVAQYKDGDLQIDPDYQRLFRWDIDQQTQYLESILLNIPSPPLFLAQNQNSKFEVIDGLQRISTLLKFFASEVFGTRSVVEPAPDLDPDPSDNNVTLPTTLTAGPIVESLEGYTAETMPESLVRTIKYSRITIILLEMESSVKARYEVFRRLNKSGSPLSDQEIRNCTARLLGKEFPNQLRNLAENPGIKSALNLPDAMVLRMGVEEVLLRFLTFNYSPRQLKHKVSEYLDEFMSDAASGKFRLTDEIVNQITSTFSLINEAFPDGRAFRLRGGPFSSNCFDVVATGVYNNLATLTAATLREKHTALIESPELAQVVGAGSNTRKRVEARLSLGKKWFEATPVQVTPDILDGP